MLEENPTFGQIQEFRHKTRRFHRISNEWNYSSKPMRYRRKSKAPCFCPSWEARHALLRNLLTPVSPNDKSFEQLAGVEGALQIETFDNCSTFQYSPQKPSGRRVGGRICG